MIEHYGKIQRMTERLSHRRPASSATMPHEMIEKIIK
jgi:hypothetical protein